MKKWSFDVSKDDTLAVKGIAIMMMLVHHLFAFPARLLPGTHFNSLFVFADSTTLEWHVSAFCKVCVAIFTLLAGYGIFKSYSSKLVPGDEQCESLLAFFALAAVWRGAGSAGRTSIFSASARRSVSS